jgi:hypothetical protein
MRATTALIVTAVLAIGLAATGCADEPTKKGPGEGGDYTTCDPAPANNQIVVCDSLKKAVESYCGFSLTVMPCECADEVFSCIENTAWLQTILDCEPASSDCNTYINCLESLGDADGCENPAEWSCITTTESTGGAEE